MQDIEQKEIAKKQAESYCCQHCNCGFSNKHNLLQHINVCKVSDKAIEQVGSDKGKEVKTGTKDKILVLQHVYLFCKGLFDDEDQLAKHSLTCVQQGGQKLNPVETNTNTFTVKATCAKCGKQFHSLSNYNQQTVVRK